MLELLVALLDDPQQTDRDISEIVCPIVEQTTLKDMHIELQAKPLERLELSYRVLDGYEIMSLERNSLMPLYTDELRVMVSTVDGSCTALIFRKTL